MKKQNKNELKWFLIYSVLVNFIVTIIYGNKIYQFIEPKQRLYAYLSIIVLTSILIFELLKIFIIDLKTMDMKKYIVVLILLVFSVLFKIDILNNPILKSKEVNRLKLNIYKVQPYNNLNLSQANSSHAQIIILIE